MIADPDDRDGAPLQIAELKQRVHELETEMAARMTAEQALHLGEKSLRTFMDQSPFAIQIFDMDGTLRHVNSAWERMWGARGEDVIGHYNPLHDDQLEATGLLPHLQRAFAGETVELLEVEFDPSSSGLPGEKHWSSARTYHLRDEAGRPQNVVVLNEDITERKRAEHKRERLEQQLHQAQKMEAIGTLAGGVAHDFNNQLSGIMGNADLLLHLMVDSEQKELVEEIMRAAERSSTLTRQLLSFARKGAVETVPVDLHSIITDVAALLERSIDKKVRIRTELGASHSVTIGDRDQIQNAVLNLALNARDAMPDGGELVLETRIEELGAAQPRTHCFPDTEEGSFITVGVRDTGHGMHEEIRSRIFEPFFTTKARGKGTGMGLPLVYGTMQNHHGAIDVRSEPGLGTEIRLLFPQAEGTHAVDTSASQTTSHNPSARIVVVDDEDAVRKALVRSLQKLGHLPTAFSGGAQALEHYEKSWREVDLVLLDIVMPEMNGLELFHLLREVNPDVKVVLISGYSGVEQAREAIDLGARAYLEKPFRLSRLADTLNGVLVGD